ncbi:MAG: hypothetical protein P4L84_12275 [Isosphaeraceae bacterium]|nr:hypothetical protein [Isosphaeraceae bacterium]
MHLRGLIQSAVLEESPPESGNIEMMVRVQGVGPGQPRRLVLPYALLVQDEDLEPESVVGRAFDADVQQDDQQRWIVETIAFASRVLRKPD